MSIQLSRGRVSGVLELSVGFVLDISEEAAQENKVDAHSKIGRHHNICVNFDGWLTLVTLSEDSLRRSLATLMVVGEMDVVAEEDGGMST